MLTNGTSKNECLQMEIQKMNAYNGNSENECLQMEIQKMNAYKWNFKK